MWCWLVASGDAGSGMEVGGIVVLAEVIYGDAS